MDRLAHIVLAERDEGMAIKRELETFFRVRYRISFSYHRGEWRWACHSERVSRVPLPGGEGTLDEMLQWCIENRSDYGNVSTE